MNIKESIKITLTKSRVNGKVDTFIIGAQKAGTTSLHKALCQHNSIFNSNHKHGKECQFWNDGPGAKSIEEYRLNFGFRKRGRLLDSTPDYISTPGTVRKILDYNRNAKFIFLLRNPVKRFVSAYNMYHHNFKHNKMWRGRSVYDNREIAEVLRDELAAHKTNKSTRRQYLYRGDYCKQILNELSPLSKEQIMISIVEDSMYRQWDAFRSDLLEFLDLEFQPIFLPKENQAIERTTASHEVIEKLKDFYLEKNKRLEDILKRDLTIWSDPD